MNQQFPWWFQKLLLHYIPDYIVYMLEQPWIPMAIMGGMVCTTLITMIYAIFRVTRERRRRKALEADHARLRERYEQLRMHYEEQAQLSQKLIAACAHFPSTHESMKSTDSHNKPTPSID